MKVTVSVDGEVSFDTDDIKQAVDMVKALRNGHAEPKPPRTYKKREPRFETVALSKELVSTWNWLVANGGEGATSDNVSQGLHISREAAAYRLITLAQKGLAHRVKRGLYRPGEASTPSAEAPTPDPEKEVGVPINE